MILDENEAVVNIRYEDKHIKAAKLFLLAEAELPAKVPATIWEKISKES